MTITMAPGASSDCTKAYPIASDAPTTSPSHGNTSSVHGESPRPIPEKRYVLSHPRLHLPHKTQHEHRCTTRAHPPGAAAQVRALCAAAAAVSSVCARQETRPGPAASATGSKRRWVGDLFIILRV